MEILISIIIPVKNGIQTIDNCLNAILSQTLISQTEIIIIDSGSTDGTLDIVKKYPVKLYEINPKDFGHGTTRNYGVSLANGKFVVMTVQDAIPSSNKWLEIMLQHFGNMQVVAVGGQQVVPHEKDKNPLQWYRPINKPTFRKVNFSKDEFYKLTPEEKRKNCVLDDVNAMYRKSNLQQIPFENTEFGEDMLWAKEALLNGFIIIFDNNSQVYHYHHYTETHILKQRINFELEYNYKYFYLLPIKQAFLYNLMRILYLCLKFKVKPKWFFYNLKILKINQRTIKNFLKSNNNFIKF